MGKEINNQSQQAEDKARREESIEWLEETVPLIPSVGQPLPERPFDPLKDLKDGVQIFSSYPHIDDARELSGDDDIAHRQSFKAQFIQQGFPVEVLDGLLGYNAANEGVQRNLKTFYVEVGVVDFSEEPMSQEYDIAKTDEMIEEERALELSENNDQIDAEFDEYFERIRNTKLS